MEPLSLEVLLGLHPCSSGEGWGPGELRWIKSKERANVKIYEQKNSFREGCFEMRFTPFSIDFEDFLSIMELRNRTEKIKLPT